MIPSAVGANSRRFSLASRRRVSPSQVNCTRTRCPRPIARHCVNSSEVKGEFFSASTCGARNSAAALSVSRRSRSRFCEPTSRESWRKFGEIFYGVGSKQYAHSCENDRQIEGEQNLRSSPWT